MPRRPAAKKRPVKKKSRLFLPYPLAVGLLLCSGVFLAAWTFGVSAQDVKVTASVKGPAVTSPATIDTPADGSHFTAVPVSVSGTCPANAAYVEIFRNNVMSGSAICEADKTYSLQSDLFPGANELTAHVFNVTDDEGPVSNKITVYYDVPQPPAGQPGSPSSSPGTPSPKSHAAPLLLKTAFVYKGYYVNEPVSWPLEISGGSSPYALNVDWGDGENSVISRRDAGQFDLEHTYKQPGNDHGSYRVRVQASDAGGGYAYIEFFVIVSAKTSHSDNIGTIYSKPPPSLNNFRRLLWVAWPAYAAVLLMVIMFKLGEREELLMLKKHGQLRH